MYSIKTATALVFLGYDPEADFTVEYADGVVSLVWNHTDPQPTEQEINDTEASQAFLDWEAENGGDPTLTTRKQIRDAVDTPTGKVLVALVQVLIDQGVIPATQQQVVTAIIAKIDSGTVD